MTLSSGCISLQENGDVAFEERNTCREELENDSLMQENITFLWYTFLFSGLFCICTSAVFIAPFVKVFKSEHRNNWYSFGVFYLSSTIINLLQVTCYALVIVLSSYFLTSQQAIDNYALNYHRMGIYMFNVWLYSVFMHSIGQLIGILFLNYIEISITMAVAINYMMVVFNQLFIDLDKTDSHFLAAVSDLIALKYLIKTLIYTFYGIGRCEKESEVAIYMSTYDVDDQLIVEYILRMVVNVLVIMLFTWLVMLCQLSSLKSILLRLFFSRRFTTSQNNENQSTKTTKIAKIEQQTVDIAENDFKYDDFLRSKIIIGWRNLSLLASTPLFVKFNAQLNDDNDKLSSNKNPRLILNNLNGQFRFGTLNGLMGASGSGKTTLLKVLNGQFKSKLSSETQFYLSRYTKITTCFIEQEVSGHLMSGLTVKQLLLYASRLKNPENSMKNHDINALSWLAELELSDISNVQVDRCSGGERKRLALALELTALQLPNLICIDEPTSGLDSNSALIVISCIRKLTLKHNITIITSIHQPNCEILHLFDQLYILALGGVCIYSGPPTQIESHLEQTATQLEGTFPIELLLKYSSGRFQNFKIQNLIEQNNSQLVGELEAIKADTRLVHNGVAQNRVRFSLFSVVNLLRRYISYIFGYYWKEFVFFSLINVCFTLTLTHIFRPEIALPSGCLSFEDNFNATCARTPEKVHQDEMIMDNVKFTFMSSSVFMLLHIFQIALSFQKDLTYFANEHQNGWYSTGAFYLMKRICEVISIIPIILMHLHLINYYEAIRPGIYWSFFMLFCVATFAMQCMAHIFALLSGKSLVLFIIIAILSMAFATLMANVFIYIHNLNYVYQFVAAFNVQRFIFNGCILLQYGFGRCGHRQIQQMLYYMQLEDGDYYVCLGMILFNGVLFQCCAIWLLVAKTNSQSSRQKQQHVTDSTKYLKLEPTQNDFIF